jgi:hypothetical protein
MWIYLEFKSLFSKTMPSLQENGLAQGAKMKRVMHGKTWTPEYRTWSSIKQKCRTTSHRMYKDYGARGIKISDEWFDSFEQFLSDIGERPVDKYSLDRIDNDGDYCKENCVWATREEQACHNRHTKKVIHRNVEYKTKEEFCKANNISRGLFNSRVKAGWGLDKILSTPIRIKRVFM